jgi:hypothetical protein
MMVGIVTICHIKNSHSCTVRMKYVVGDFESTAQKIIHSISFTPVDVTEKKTWVSHGRSQPPEYRKNRSVTHGEL